MRHRLLPAALAIAVSSCSGDTGEPVHLVVAIVYDQFPRWAYAKYDELLSPEGALRRTRARGADHVVEYPYAATYTAPGHAMIFTPYDRRVPAVFSGPGVDNVNGTTPLPMNRVTASLCALLGVEPPVQVVAVEPLPGIRPDYTVPACSE